MTTTVESIRAIYPNPKRGYLCRVGDYCVGGAFIVYVHPGLYSNRQFMVPTYRRLQQVLYEVNPKLSLDVAIDFAKGIIDANDDGAFDEAWHRLDAALKYGSQPCD